MQNTITENLQEVAKFRHENPEQVIAEAIEIGLQKMRGDAVLAQYLKKKLSRRRAIQMVGLELVKLADYQDKIIQEDIRWGLSGEAHRR